MIGHTFEVIAVPVGSNLNLRLKGTEDPVKDASLSITMDSGPVGLGSVAVSSCHNVFGPNTRVRVTRLGNNEVNVATV